MGTRTGEEMGASVGMGARTGVGTGTGIEMSMEGRESLGTYEVVKEVGRKTRKEGRRQRATINHSRKTQRSSETVASFGGPKPWGEKRGTRLRRMQERRRSARNPKRVIEVMWKTT